MHKRHLITFIIIQLWLLNISYGGVIREDIPLSQYLSLAAPFDCVGKVIDSSGHVSSCVLINEQFIISAAHVFIRREFRLDTIHRGNQTIIANVPINETLDDINNYYFEFKNRKYKALQFCIYPEYLNSDKKSGDLILIKLDSKINDITIPPLNTKYNELMDTVIGVGYGASGVANDPGTVKFNNLKIAGTNIIDSIGGRKINNINSLLLADFDCPKNNCNVFGDSIPTKLEYIPSGGDSGGGLFKIANGRYVLSGICSSTFFSFENENINYYGSTMGWLRLSLFNEWINKNIQQNCN